MLPGGDSTSAASSQDDRRVMRIMPVPVAKTAAEQNHRIIKHRSFAFFHVPQFSKQIGILLDVPPVDELILPQHFRISLMMRDVVMTAADPLEKRKILVADFVAEHERGDSRRIALEGQ